VILPQIMVAPNGARLGKSDHPALPVTIPEITACALACQGAGAAGIHAHVRDADGQHALDAGLYRELLTELAQATPGFFVQITTEAVGRYSPADQRRLVAQVQPRAVSVALAEMTTDPDTATLRRFYHDTAEAGVALQHILYSTADIDHLANLIAQGVIPDGPVQILHVLGRHTPGQHSTPTDLGAPLARHRARIPQADWAVCAFGPQETTCLTYAIRQGGKARIGFENNLLNAGGQPATDNAARVAELRAAIQTAMSAAACPPRHSANGPPSTP